MAGPARAAADEGDAHLDRRLSKGTPIMVRRACRQRLGGRDASSEPSGRGAGRGSEDRATGGAWLSLDHREDRA